MGILEDHNITDKRSWMQWCKKNHPDRDGNHELFCEVKQAYDQQIANDDAGNTHTGRKRAKPSRPSGGLFADMPRDEEHISIENFDLSVAGVHLLKKTKLSIAKGIRYGLLGKNGSGKTTLMKWIDEHYPAALLVAQEVQATEVSVWDTVLMTHATLYSAKKQIETLETLDEMTDDQLELYNTLQEQWSANGYDACESDLHRILNGLGFNDPGLPVSSFSGGWRMRIALASALFVKPPLLLLDEPTNHLDLAGVLWLIDYLSTWTGTLLTVSHDIEFLNAVCNRIVHLYDEKLRYYRGGYSKFKLMFQQNQKKKADEWDKYKKKFKAFKKTGPGKKALQEFVEKHAVPEIKPEKKTTLDIVPSSELPGIILGLHGVSFGWDGKAALFHDIELGIDMESRYTIVGVNGIGKSSLMKILAGELEPTGGEVTRSRHLRVGYYHQHAHETLPLDISAVEYLLTIDESLGMQGARKWLGKIGLPGPVHIKEMSGLSGGQKARVAFTAVLLSKPHILLLDEPTNHLDIETIEVLVDALCRFQGGIVTITHDIRLIEKTESIILKIEEESLEEVLQDEYFDSVLGD